MKRALLAVLCLSFLLPLRSSAKDLPKVAVLEFSSKSSGLKDLADMLADLVANAIREFGVYSVVGSSDLASMINFEKIKDKLGCDDISCLAEIGGALGVELIVTGNFGRVGRLYLVNLKLIKPKTAEVKSGISEKIRGSEEDLVEALPGIVEKLFENELPEALALRDVHDEEIEVSDPQSKAPVVKIQDPEPVETSEDQPTENHQTAIEPEPVQVPTTRLEAWEEERLPYQAIGWTLAALAVALAGGAGALGYFGSVEEQKADDRFDDYMAFKDSRENVQQAADAAGMNYHLAWGLGAGALLAVVGSVVSFVLSPDRPETKVGVSMTPVILPDGAAFMLQFPVEVTR